MESAKKFRDVHRQKKQKKEYDMPKTIVVPLFFGLPGLGKTTFYNELKKIREDTNIFVDYLSEDKIWEKLMFEQRQKCPSMTEGEIFIAIKDKGNVMFWEKVERKLGALAEAKHDHIILFLDKIIYPDTIDKILGSMMEIKPLNVNLQFVAVLPQIGEPHSVYPFSLSMLFDCIERVV
jgi:hypothetical protein